MRGNCKHDVSVETGEQVYDRSTRQIVNVQYDHPCVSLANDDDSEYCQIFETADELDQFIRELVDARQQAFGDNRTWLQQTRAG